MKIRASSYTFIVLMVAMLIVIYSSLQMEDFKSKLLPLIVSCTVFVLAAIGLGKTVLTGNKDKVTQVDEEASIVKASWSGYLVQGAWIVGFFAAIMLVSLIVAIPLFILSYMKLHGTSWVVTIILSIMTTAFVYGTFELFLGANLHSGLIFTWLGY